jgi:hypothetical protein
MGDDPSDSRDGGRIVPLTLTAALSLSLHLPWTADCRLRQSQALRSLVVVLYLQVLCILHELDTHAF